MNRTWQISFWICLTLLILTNALSYLNHIDREILLEDQGVARNSYREDAVTLKKITDSFTDQDSLLQFLEANEIVPDTFSKGTNLVVQFGSFDMVFDLSGKLLTSRSHFIQNMGSGDTKTDTPETE